MSRRPEVLAKVKVDEASQRLERGIDDAASGLRRKGADIREYLKQVHADVEEWKFGVEESKDGYRVEWRVVALIKRPAKDS